MKIRHAFILKNELVGEEGKQMEERNRVLKNEEILSSLPRWHLPNPSGLNMASAYNIHICGSYDKILGIRENERSGQKHLLLSTHTHRGFFDITVSAPRKN